MKCSCFIAALVGSSLIVEFSDVATLFVNNLSLIVEYGSVTAEVINGKTKEGVDYFTNFDLENVITPVKVDELERLLVQANFCPLKTKFLVDGFTNGFSIGYGGDMNVRKFSPNLKLRVGNETILWNKVMKEVKLCRYAGPFSEPPFKFFVQSPIGLVPKDGTNHRLIFHLSYPRSGDSINSGTPREICKVKYCEFDDAIKRCLEEGVGCFISRSDFSAAFRNLGIKKEHWPLLVMKARCPLDQKWYFFVDKCLPFGASISCSHFQAFSDAVAFLVFNRTSKKVTNYLDDFLFAALLGLICNQQVKVFLEICRIINFPVNKEKTFWGTTRLTFLGLLIDTLRQVVCIPVEKVARATSLITEILAKRKVTVHQLQKLCGFLNFLCRAVVLGRAFTRRLYAYTAGDQLKLHHHVQINAEMRADLTTWLTFLSYPSIFCRPFLDYSDYSAQELDWYSDSSRNFKLGFGCVFGMKWAHGRWDEFVEHVQPSIEYLELFAVAVSVLLWAKHIQNKRVFLFCDNMSVVYMLNNSTSSCKNCMVLIRIIMLESVKQNVRIFAKHVRTDLNGPSDALSRLQFDRFYRLTAAEGKVMEPVAELLPGSIWPISKIWMSS